MSARHALAWLAALLLAGCGIQVEIAPENAPTATPTPAPVYSYFDPNGMERLVAEPRLVFFGPAIAEVRLFTVAEPRDVYLLTGREIWLHLDYEAIWFDTPQGNGRARLGIYTRRDGDQPWSAYGASEQELMVSSAPATLRDSLWVTYHAEEPGPLQLRSEVSMVAFPVGAEVINPVSTTELAMTVFSDPGETEYDPGALWPPLGDLDATPLLFDTRGWDGGPCASVEAGFELGDACEAVESGDLGAAAEALESFLNEFDGESDPPNAAHFLDMAGLLRAMQGDFGGAAQHFEVSGRVWQLVDSPREFAVTAHNRAAALAMQGDDQRERAVDMLQQVEELRSQLGDEPGRLLTRANVALLIGDSGPLYEVADYFESAGLPQGAIVRAWIERMESGS